MNVDLMLSYAGDFGRYQWLLMFLFAIINILSSFHYFSQTFISVVPGYTCFTGNELSENYDLNQCYQYDNLNNSVMQCKSWNYTLSYGYSSVIDELNWICSEAWKPATGQSLYFIGSVIGTMGFGFLADKIGRLHVLVLANMIALVGNLVTVFTSDFYTFSTGRFIAGIATDSNFVMMYIIVMEYIRPEMRTFGLNLTIGVFYCIGCTIVPWLAVLSTNWRIFLTAVSLPFSITLSFYYIVPESAQWLISQKRVDEALKCFHRIARLNKKIIPDSAVDELRKYSQENIETKQSGNILGLFKTPCLRRKTCILIFKSMVITLCYDAISKNINGLGFSPFIMFSITSATIFPACVVLLLLQDKIGRKAMACFSLFISGIFTAGTGIILASSKEPDSFVTLTLSVIARFGINVAYNSGHQYAVELIPTEVRGQGVAAVHVAGYAVTFFSSQILYMAVYNKAIPDLILGVLSITGAIGCLFLPETLGRTLPVTLNDGEHFGEQERVFDFAFCGRSKKESTMTLVSAEVTGKGLSNKAELTKKAP